MSVMKQFLVYIFCLTMILQSMFGQFLLLNLSTGSIALPPTITTLFNIGDDASQRLSSQMRNSMENNEKSSSKCKISRDSLAEHLFSPSNCPTEGSHVIVANHYVPMGNTFNLFTNQEKIHSHLVLYSDLYRSIEIGLPINKIIYPFHNFY